MEVTIQVPEDIADRWQAQGDIPREVLEGAALEAYRKRIIGESRLQLWLGFETRFDVFRFLTEHGMPVNYSLEDLEHDRQTHDRLGV
jgi:Uncharacterised protein family (UPF0175)